LGTTKPRWLFTDALRAAAIFFSKLRATTSLVVSLFSGLNHHATASADRARFRFGGSVCFSHGHSLPHTKKRTGVGQF
jgi:hypothetical protein